MQSTMGPSASAIATIQLVGGDHGPGARSILELSHSAWRQAIWIIDSYWRFDDGELFSVFGYGAVDTGLANRMADTLEAVLRETEDGSAVGSESAALFLSSKDGQPASTRRRRAPTPSAESSTWLEPAVMESLISFVRNAGVVRVRIGDRDLPESEPPTLPGLEAARPCPVPPQRSYCVPESIEQGTLRVRTRVPDAERRLGDLLSLLASAELRYHTGCSVLPEEREIIGDLGAWPLGIDPGEYTTERMLESLRALWDLIRARVCRSERTPGEQFPGSRGGPELLR